MSTQKTPINISHHLAYLVENVPGLLLVHAFNLYIDKFPAYANSEPGMAFLNEATLRVRQSGTDQLRSFLNTNITDLCTVLAYGSKQSVQALRLQVGATNKVQKFLDVKPPTFKMGQNFNGSGEAPNKLISGQVLLSTPALRAVGLELTNDVEVFADVEVAFYSADKSYINWNYLHARVISFSMLSTSGDVVSLSDQQTEMLERHVAVTEITLNDVRIPNTTTSDKTFHAEKEKMILWVEHAVDVRYAEPDKNESLI